MKVTSPIGEYEYRVKDVSFRGGRLEVLGSLGQWETTMVVEPSDFAALARKAAPFAAAAALAAGAARRLRRR
jgi:hypothetical protein